MAVRSVEELLQLLQIDTAIADIHPLQNEFPLRVPRGFIQRMVKGDSRDPLLLQVLPVLQESLEVSGFTTDPLAERLPVPFIAAIASGDTSPTLTPIRRVDNGKRRSDISHNIPRSLNSYSAAVIR